MTLRHYTEAELDTFRSISKRIINSRVRWLVKPKTRPVHLQRNFNVQAKHDSEICFQIYQRQSLDDNNDFSCGISYLPADAQPLTLARYNGPSHNHVNIHWRPHIHRATEVAIASGKRPESMAEETDRYDSLEGALACLLEDFKVEGLYAIHDAESLF